MKSYVLLLALLQSLGCLGIPLYNSELESMADRGLGAALAELNSVYAVSQLYRVTQGYVRRVIPRDLHTVDLLLVFDIKETECAKASRNDPQTCAFRPGFFVPTFSCSSHIRTSATTTQVVSLHCSHHRSSSSESSEEMFAYRRSNIARLRLHQYRFENRVPAPSAPPPPVDQRRQTSSNYLV